MKPIATFLLIFLSLTAIGQSDVANVFPMSSTLYDLGRAVFPNGDGYAVVGYMVSTASDPDRKGDLFLLRLDHNGNEISRHFYGLPDKVETMDHTAVAVGNNGWLIGGTQTTPNGQQIKGYLVRVAADGSVLWTKTIGTSTFYIDDAVALPSGDFIVVGNNGSVLYTARLSADGDIKWIKENQDYGYGNGICTNPTGSSCFVMSGSNILKIRSSDGAIIWTKTAEYPVFGLPGGFIYGSVFDITYMSEGKFAISGIVYNDQIFSFETVPFASVWTESGDNLWTKAFDQDARALEGHSIAYLPNQQQLLIAGEGTEGIAVTRVDKDGHYLESNHIPTPNAWYFPILIKKGGEYIATGGSFYGGMNTFFWRSGGNWLPNGTLRSGDRDANPAVLVALSPNPATTTISVNFEAKSAENTPIRIVNGLGQTMQETTHWIEAGQNNIVLDVSSLPRGMYWLEMPSLRVQPQAWTKE